MRTESRTKTGSHLDPAMLQTFTDHETSAADTLRVARHLGACHDCQGMHSRLEALCNHLSSLPGAEVPEGFSHQVMRRVADMPPPRGHTPWLRLVAPVATAMVLAWVALANPWTVRLARGIGGWMPENAPGAHEVMDLLFALGATVLATLARAAGNLGPWFSAPTVASGTWFPFQAPLLMLLAALLAGLLGIAVAGSGLWFLRARRVSAGGTTD